MVQLSYSRCIPKQRQVAQLIGSEYVILLRPIREASVAQTA